MVRKSVIDSIINHQEGDCIFALATFTFRPCLVAFKLSKLYKIFYHIEYFNACMKY